MVTPIFAAKIDGMHDLIGRLSTFRRGVRNRILRPALTKAQRPVLKMMKVLMRYDTTWLKNALGFRIHTSKKSGRVVAIIGPRTKMKRMLMDSRGKVVLRWATKYAHFVEGGVKRHFIPIKRGFFAGRIIDHPGHIAYRPLQRSWNATHGTAEAILRREIEAGIKREASKQ